MLARLRGSVPIEKTTIPSRADIKGQLSAFDRAGLPRLLQNLYAASKNNPAFLHVRFGIGDDFLKPYKSIIGRYLWPDARENQTPSVSKAKQAISGYRKAIGRQEELAELQVFYWERADDIGMDVEGFLVALARMYKQALKSAVALPYDERDAPVARLDAVRRISCNFGYGVSDDMNTLFAEYVSDDR